MEPIVFELPGLSRAAAAALLRLEHVSLRPEPGVF